MICTDIRCHSALCQLTITSSSSLPPQSAALWAFSSSPLCLPHLHLGAIPGPEIAALAFDPPVFALNSLVVVGHSAQSGVGKCHINRRPGGIATQLQKPLSLASCNWAA